MTILNIAGYQFISLQGLSELRVNLLEYARTLQLKGTILLSIEGINVALAGDDTAVKAFIRFLKKDLRFSDMTFRESGSDTVPFKQMKVKIKKEIITFGEPAIRPALQRAPSISPHTFKQWLDENRDILVLDTRNSYEICFGTFARATHCKLDDFSEFPRASDNLPKTKPIVMFCTGGVRCEKAGLYLLNSGFSEVYQLEGGILNYFSEVGSAHYQGDCFVFDDRVAVSPDLKTAKLT